MKRNYKILLIAISVAAVLIAAVATTAIAASKTSVPNANRIFPAVSRAVPTDFTPTEADYEAWGCPMAGGDLSAVATLLGMTPEEIDAQLQQSKSLVEIAATKGITENQLVEAIISPMKQFMQQQVTAGTWTQAQLDSRLQFAEQHIRQLVNNKGYADNYGSCGGAGMMNGWNSNTSNSNSYSGGGMMDGWGGNNNGSYGRGGMMGGGSGGMMGRRGNSNGSYGGRMMGGGSGGIMGGWGRTY